MNRAPSIAFDEARRPVATVDFDFAAVAAHLDGEQDAVADSERKARLETIGALLRFLTTRANAKRAGQRAHLLAYLTGQSAARNQRQLARLLGVTPGAVSQKLNVLRREFCKLAKAE